MKLLAIETSCDETAIAVVEDGNRVLSNVVASQMAAHADFGGVMPELASRMHVEQLTYVLRQALSEAKVSLHDIDAIAVTQGPGLIGALHVGMVMAKTLAWYYQKPLIPVHHIVGHIYANRFVGEIEYPSLALIVSGGHTELVLLKGPLDFECLGQTQDDALGEAYDKVARLLKLGYPGGPRIDALAAQGQAQYTLPRTKTQGPYDFSFSGLKSAIAQRVANTPDLNVANLAHDFQEAAIDHVMEKTLKALQDVPVQQFILGGGVAANSRLRERIDALRDIYPDLKVSLPPLWCCTDNAAMIGAAGDLLHRAGVRADLDVAAHANLTYL
jgi:N6-L-threonylcarbamoyladenine synthase